MPGITGIVSPLERDALPAILSSMAAAVRTSGAEERAWVRAGVGISVTGRSSTAMLAERHDCVAALTGRVTPDGVLEDRLRMVPGGCSTENMAQCLLDLYLRLGPQALEGLNGAYLAAIWDDPHGRLTLVGDRGGLEPLYYWHQGSRLVFASRMASIAAHPRFNRRVDPVALLDLLAAEQMLDERTLFADAQALPPSARLTFERGQLEVESYWSPRFYVPGDLAPDEDEAIDGIADRVTAAVARQMQAAGVSTSWVPSMSDTIPNTSGPLHNASVEFSLQKEPLPEPPPASPLVCLLLTGGLDSRLLAAALTRIVEPGQISAATIGHARARDVRYGAQIARATGLEHTLLPSNPRYLVDHAAECVRRTEGGLNVHASWILETSAYLRGAGFSSVVTGVGAEAISGRHWLSEQPVSTRQEALERFVKARWAYPNAAGLLRPEFRSHAYFASRDSLRRTLEDAPSDHLLGWADYFSYRQSHRHPTGSILSDDSAVLEPYFDNDLIDYVFRLPPALRMKGILFKKMIVYRFPEVAAIGYTDSGLMLLDEVTGVRPPYHLGSWFKNVGRRISKRVAKKLSFLSLPSNSDNPAHAIYYNTWLRTDARAFVLDIVAQQDLYADFLDVAAVRRLVDDHMAGRADSFRLVNAVLTFALWRKMIG